MRHGKAEPFASTDHARRLTGRGVDDAASAGVHLADTGFVPNYAVVSTAERARMTWAAVREAAGSSATEVLDDAVYHGGTDTVLEALRALPEDACTAIVVGHNPTVSDLSHLLDDGTGDPDAVRGMLHGFAPGALVVLDVAVAWSELGPECGRVLDFHASGT